jgi:hypothetical protein
VFLTGGPGQQRPGNPQLAAFRRISRDRDVVLVDQQAPG